MPVTKDLKPDEFEITTVCPVGACLAQHTYTYSEELKKHRQQLKAAKAMLFQQVKNAHIAGKHNIGGRA